MYSVPFPSVLHASSWVILKLQWIW